MEAADFSERDEPQLADRGISVAEARRQVELLRRPRSYAELVRPCTVADGIRRFSPEALPGLHAAHGEAAGAGRFVKFVPASGAATRMFKQLLYFQEGAGRVSFAEVRDQAEKGQAEAATLIDCLREIRRFAFYTELGDELRQRDEDLDALARAGAFRPILEALLGSDGMGYGVRPKGLLKFHGYPEGGRTSFEEHLVEAANYVRDAEGLCRLHFTVSPDHRPAFEALYRSVADDYTRRHEARFAIGYSVQKPFTDTLAVDGQGRLLRDESERLRFRPGGHGALLANLNELRADLIFIKNIDNIQPDRLKPATFEWKKGLGGHLVRLQRRIFRFLDELREPDPAEALLDEALDFARVELGLEPDSQPGPPTYQCKRAFLIHKLNRPLRVCGVVPNTGEPGGGPFWVRGPDGAPSLQIVESAEVDPGSAAQQEILHASTHFNPVDLVCGVRDAAGRPFDLAEFVDEQAVIVTRKSEAGRELRVLERPGLWNGAMAGWNTVFVEVPLETFSPVKTVLDLLRDEHQAG